jgi:hypothetical protein
MDFAGRNYGQGTARVVLNAAGGHLISRLSNSGVGSFLSSSTRSFISKSFGEVYGAVIGMALNPDSPVNCEAIQ